MPVDARGYPPAMRTRLVLPVLLIAVLAACGSGGGGSTTTNPPANASPTAVGQPTQASGGNSTLDCAKIKAAGADMIVAVQLLAQLTTPDNVELVKSKTIGNLDLDAFLADMHELHALDAYPSVLGDPKAAIDAYEKAATAAKVLFATEPVTQAAIDTYNQNVGTLTDFLGHQAAISAAMDAAHC